MAVRPRRKEPISTRPIYLPKVPARELREAATGRTPVEGPCLRIYVDGAPGGLDLEALAHRLGRSQALPAAVEGELVSALAGRPHTEVRDAVAALAHRLAWARIRDPAKREYRVLPLHGEVDEEEARLRARSLPEYEGLQAPPAPTGLLYDGAEVQAAFREVLSPDGGGGATYIAITDRLLGCWDAGAGRWTPSAVLAGVPVLASVRGGEGPPDPETLIDEIRQALEPSGPV